MIESLENKKAALELLQNETNEKLQDYRQQISILQKQIEDYNKPELTPNLLVDIQEAIEDAVCSYNFDDVDMYDIELEMDYDGRVSASTINLNETYDLVERIVRNVHNLFKEADAPEETEDAQLALFSRGEGGNVVSFRVGTYKIYKRQDKAKTKREYSDWKNCMIP